MNATLVRKGSTEQISEFMHRLIDELCGRDGPREKDFVSSVWTAPEFVVAVKTWKELLTKYVDVRSKNEITADVGEELQKAIYDCIDVRRIELKNAIANQVIADCCPLVLQNFDWQLKMVLASDKMCDINEHLVNLDLSLSGSEGNNKRKKVISFEMSKDELRQLIDSLEEAQNACRGD